MGPPWPGDQPRCRGGRLQPGRPPPRGAQPPPPPARQPWKPHPRRGDGRDGRRGAEPGVLDRRCGDPHRGGAARRSGSQPPAGPDHDPDGRSELLVDRALQVTTQPEPNGARHRSAPDLGRREFLLGAGAAAVAGWTAARASAALAGTGPRFQGVDEFDADVPTSWFDVALDLVRTTAGYSPPVASRAFGYTGVALYEALVPGMDGYRSLEGMLAGLGGVPAAGRKTAYHWPTVANATLGSILRDLFRTGRPEQLAAVDALESSFRDRFRPGLPPGVFGRSVRRGQEVAAAVFDWSEGDGGHEGYLTNFPPYDAPVGPGYWVPTPPDFLPALQPYWGMNRCLALPATTLRSPRTPGPPSTPRRPRCTRRSTT